MLYVTKGRCLRAIKNGDLDRLREVLEIYPDYLKEEFVWGQGMYFGSLLHVAAYYNRPEMLEYLTYNKRMKLEKRNSNDSTPLHYAALNNASEAVEMLLKLGADPQLTNKKAKTPYDLCEDNTASQGMLRVYLEKKRQQEELAKPQQEKKPVEAEQTKELQETAELQTEIKDAAGWQLTDSPDEVVYERDIRGLRLTETFNFKAAIRILISESLKTGQLSQPETKAFGDIPEMAALARAEWDKLRGKKHSLVLKAQ